MIRNRHVILGLLTALNLVNYIDRFLVMAVSLKFQQELGLSDGQVGWVISAFMFGYFLTSPLFGVLAGRMPRKVLIAAGVVTWCVATVASGFASSFATLVATRIFVGVGEASYATLSPTIIDDLASKEEKNRWLAIFYVAIPVGAALGFLLGGELQAAYGWRGAFFVAGGPGLLFAVATLFIVEPASAQKQSDTTTYRELARHPTYVATVVGYVAQTFALGGFTATAVPFLFRKHCLEETSADRAMGVIAVATGLLGTAIGGALASRWPGADRTKAALRLCAWTSIVAAPIGFVALRLSSATGFLVALAACELAIFASVAPTNVAVLQSVPPALRARAMAASIFAIHLFGDLISPPIVGTISDALGDAKERCSSGRGLETGMYLLPAAIALSGFFWWRASGASRPEGPSQDTATKDGALSSRPSSS